MQIIDFLHFSCCNYRLCSTSCCSTQFSSWMATSSGLVLHRCWSMLAYRGVAFRWISPRLMLSFHSVCATATATFATSLGVKASSDRCSSRFGTRACSSKSNQLTRRCSANAIVVVDDEKYGNKQVISVTPRLYDYILANVREPEVVNFFPISFQ